MTRRKLVFPIESAQDFIEAQFRESFYQKDLEHLLKFSGFPEPLTKGNEIFSSSWHESYIDTLVKEDLRDLTRIHELENVIHLISFLPERIGSPLSLNSLKEDLHVSYNAVKNYLKGLLLTHVLFEIPPYSRKLKNAVIKEKKIYFYDWTLTADESKRFENYVACELKNWVQLWSNKTKYKFELFFVRMRDKKETDFLITKDQRPFLLVEAKLSSDTIDSSHILHAKQLGDIPVVQIVQKKDVLKTYSKNAYLISASRFF
jgi:predicted AAA+ superfamily ATPase